MRPPVVGWLGPPRLTAGLDRADRLDRRAHLAVHGDLRPLDLITALDLAELINLRGRGGAGFPFARKLDAVHRSAQRRGLPATVVVNGTEGEPASWKDKVLLTRAPHLVLDGAALAAYALDAESIVIGVADDGVAAGSVLAAVAERRMPAPTRLVTMPHRFISGESGALIRGINGDVPIPPGRKGRASDAGVDGRPTLLSNAETYAQLAVAARLGPYAFGEVGTADEPGTVLLTVGGSARRPAVLEVPAGVPLRQVLEHCAATVGPGVLLGGFHGSWIGPAAAAAAVVSRAGLAAVGGTLGAGIILPLGDGTCPLGETDRVLRYLAGQSAGQCGPCQLGLPDLARTLSTVSHGGGGTAALDRVRAAAGAVRGRGACSHPDGTARFALSAVDTFAEDIAAHVSRGGCGDPVRGVLPLPGEDATGGRLVIDWSRCDGHGLCAQLAPELITLDANGFPSVADAPVPPWLVSGARKAIAMCPALALRQDA